MKANQKAHYEIRWRIALHESGHLVTWRAGNIWNTHCAANIRDGEGYAVPPAGLSVPAFAVGVAAAEYAERLIRRFPVPHMRPAPEPNPTPENGGTAEAMRHAATVDVNYGTVRRGPDDALTLARICITYAPDTPADWMERHSHFHAEARRMVRKHAADIRRVALILFKSGAYVHEGNPADNAFFRMVREDNETTK